MTLPVFETFNVTVGTANTDVVLTKPSGLVAGNSLLVIVVTDGAGESIQPPNNTWVKGITNVSNTMTIRYFWKNATATDVAETDYTFTWGSTEAVVAGICRMSGCDLSGILVDVSDVATGTSATPTCPSVITTVPDTLVLRMYGCDDDERATEDTGYPAGTTGVYARVSGVAVGGDCTSGLAHEPQVSAGATGTAAFTIDLSEGWVAITIAIREAQVEDGKDIKVQHFHYTLPTGTGNNSFTGLDFTPKALVFFGNANTGAGGQADAIFWQGMADDTNEFAISSYGEDSAQNTHRHINESNGIMALLIPGATESFLGAFVSFNSDGFTFNFSNGAPAGTVAHGVAVGGDDAQVLVGSVDSDVLGSRVDVGFRTDLIFTMNLGLALGAADSEHGIQSVGVAARNRDQGVDDAVSDAHPQSCVVTYQGNDAADQTSKHSFLSTINMTGQTFQLALTWAINLIHVTGNEIYWGNIENADGFYFLAIYTGGIKTAAGTFAKATGAAPVAQSLPDLGFTPQAYGLISGGKATEVATPAADASVSVGNLSSRGGSLVQGSVSIHDDTGATDATQRQEAGILMQFLGAADSLVAEAIADPVTDSTPSFTWDPNDAVAKLIGYWAVEQEPQDRQHPVTVGKAF